MMEVISRPDMELKVYDKVDMDVDSDYPMDRPYFRLVRKSRLFELRVRLEEAYVEHWEFPTERFVRYEASDVEWGRYFGVFKLVRDPLIAGKTFDLERFAGRSLRVLVTDVEFPEALWRCHIPMVKVSGLVIGER